MTTSTVPASTVPAVRYPTNALTAASERTLARGNGVHAIGIDDDVLRSARESCATLDRDRGEHDTTPCVGENRTPMTPMATITRHAWKTAIQPRRRSRIGGR